MVASGFLLFASLAPTTSAATASPCVPGRSPTQTSTNDNFVGFENTPGFNVGGVTANMVVYAPYTDSSYVSAWTMLHAGTSPVSDYGQVGYIEDQAGTGFMGDVTVPVFFVETANMANYPWNAIIQPPPDTQVMLGFEFGAHTIPVFAPPLGAE